MTEPQETHGRRGSWNGPPPWMRGEGGFPRAGRRFRRAALVALVLVVVLVSALATVVASAVSGNAPSHRITLPLAAAVVIGLILTARWLWRNTRTVSALMDAADRVAGGDYSVRIDVAGSRRLGPLTAAFNAMTERLRTDDERRRELLADVAHELRTPLQVIRGSVEGMIDGLYPADAERLRPLLDETIVMARLLDDLRTLSMAEAGVLQLHREAVDPGVLADDAVRTFGSVAADAGVAIEATVASDAPALIEADPVRLGEVLSNLVGNAVRHTPSGGRVEIHLSGEGDASVFEVTDTGSGIAADRLPFVFDRFVTAADTGGTGLGLSIAKRLVEAHGGTIEATSPAGGGTTIRFSVPGR
jgi:signal transduction histidine kinase